MERDRPWWGVTNDAVVRLPDHAPDRAIRTNACSVFVRTTRPAMSIRTLTWTHQLVASARAGYGHNVAPDERGQSPLGPQHLCHQSGDRNARGFVRAIHLAGNSFAGDFVQHMAGAGLAGDMGRPGGGPVRRQGFRVDTVVRERCVLVRAGLPEPGLPGGNLDSFRRDPGAPGDVQRLHPLPSFDQPEPDLALDAGLGVGWTWS